MKIDSLEDLTERYLVMSLCKDGHRLVSQEGSQDEAIASFLKEREREDFECGAVFVCIMKRIKQRKGDENDRHQGTR